MLVTCLLISLLYHTACADSIVHLQHVAPISKLHELVLGEVLPCCGEEYQRRRVVNNRACLARPAVIVRPLTTEDVAIAVNFAKRNGFQVSFVFIQCVQVHYKHNFQSSSLFQISVRSGGHGYTCNSIRDGGIQIDMRG